jgi:Ca2+-dependent lipid-binding protein
MALFDLNLRVIEATGVPKMDLIGSCDPFVILQVEGKEQRTRVLDNTLQPKWNESFFWPRLNPLTASLRLFVKDQDKLTSDPIGSLEVPLFNFPPGQCHDITLEIKPAPTIKSGCKVHLLIHFTGPGEVPFGGR